jgi:DNA-binding MarR family transcriptional regulator
MSGLEDPDLVKADYETLAEFRYLLRTFMSFSEDAARRTGLTAQRHQALLAIHGFPDGEAITVGALAERLNIRQHSAVGLVNRLAAEGLIRRHRDAADRRRVHVELKSKGLVKLAGLSRAHREELRRLAPLLKRLLAQFERS